MSIIQTIRDKGAKISVALIALALIGFILTDYFSGRGRNVFSGGSSTVGTVNGKKINYEDFKKLVDLNQSNAENMYKQQGMPAPPAARLVKEAVDQAWNQEVSMMLLREEFDRIGMMIGKKERGDIVYGPGAPEFIKTNFGTDQTTGQYDPIRAKQQYDQWRKNRQVPQSQKDEVANYINSLDDNRLRDKYISLFTNSINFPRWFVEKQVNDNAQVAKISMVRMLYTDSSFVDSTIKITDKEIADHINKNKDKFKQEESRNISFVAFSAAPTKSDSAETKKFLLELKPEFDTTNDVANFVARNGNPEPQDRYYTAAQLPMAGKDSIMRLSKNGVYGPYLEGGTYVMVKLLETKTLPDSVKARHILIQTFDPQNNVQMLDDATAKKRIDSIDAAIKGGARFDSLAVQFSNDQSSASKGGLLSNPQNPATNYFTYGTMVKEFNDFSFEGRPGEKKIVKTVFGYHLIEILDQKNFQPAYKIAYLTKEVGASQQTVNDAEQAANEFFGQGIKDMASFDAAYEKVAKAKGGVKGAAVNIKPLDAVVNTTGAPMVSRQFVSNVYKAKLGDVLKPERVESNYVVAIVTEVNEEGTMSVAKVRPLVEFELRKKKKAAIIKQKIGSVSTLEAASAALGKPIETVDSVRMSIGFTNSLGTEPRVVGAIFNPSNKGKVVPEAIEGVSGVFVIRVENVGATSSTQGSVEDQRKAKYMDAQRQQPGPMEGLRKAAKIKDKRADRF